MDQFLKTRVEIETLHELLPELDYYGILLIEHDTPQNEIDAAFRKQSRMLHPDRFARIGDHRLKSQVNAIYRFLNEAFRTLRDPETRALYDTERSTGATRLTDKGRRQAATDAANSANPEHAAKTPKGEKYWKMALKCWEDKDFKGCALQIQFALTFEPDNQTFKEWQKKAQKADAESDQSKLHPYKLRIM